MVITDMEERTYFTFLKDIKLKTLPDRAGICKGKGMGPKEKGKTKDTHILGCWEHLRQDGGKGEDR